MGEGCKKYAQSYVLLWCIECVAWPKLSAGNVVESPLGSWVRNAIVCTEVADLIISVAWTMAVVGGYRCYLCCRRYRCHHKNQTVRARKGELTCVAKHLVCHTVLEYIAYIAMGMSRQEILL